jgi:2-C-methyl-D-erythritol 2,4-cyclodiphosphate synthase
MAHTPHRIGYGEDAHALAPNRPLRLGGVPIPEAARGSVAHSDGDVLLHALTDALLSSFALGDIGKLFPDTDAAHKDADSAQLLQRAWEVVVAQAGGLTLLQVAAVVTLDQPKLGVHREAIAARVAQLLGLDAGNVGITFKTSEGLAPDHVQARVVVLWG